MTQTFGNEGSTALCLIICERTRGTTSHEVYDLMTDAFPKTIVRTKERNGKGLDKRQRKSVEYVP